MRVLVKNIISKGFLEILFLSKRRTLELRMVFELIIDKDGAIGQNFPDFQCGSQSESRLRMMASVQMMLECKLNWIGYQTEASVKLADFMTDF